MSSIHRTNSNSEKTRLPSYADDKILIIEINKITYAELINNKIGNINTALQNLGHSPNPSKMQMILISTRYKNINFNNKLKKK